MNEHEIKILEVHESALVSKLSVLGAKRFFDGDIAATLYDFPDQSLAKEGKTVRLRSMGSEATVIYKGKETGSGFVKERPKYGAYVGDILVLDALLKGIGLVPSESIPRFYSKGYELERISFKFDTYPGIPTILEIEAGTDAEVGAWLSKLGFSPADALP